MDQEVEKKDVGDELNEFLDMTAKDTTPVVEKEETTKVVTEKPVTEVKTEVKVDAKAEPKVDKEPEDDLVGMSDGELRTVVRGLRSKVDEAHGRLITGPGQVRSDEPVKVDTVTATKIEKKVEAEVINFLKDVNMDEIIDSPEALNKLLVNVYNKAITDAETRAVEKVLRSIPQLVVNYASRHATMADMVREFYTENSDLSSVKRTVAAVANEVAAEHSDWEVKDVFKEAAVRTRGLLGMRRRESVTPSDKGNDPAFIKKGGSRKPAGRETAGMNDLQKEVADLIS